MNLDEKPFQRINNGNNMEFKSVQTHKHIGESHQQNIYISVSLCDIN